MRVILIYNPTAGNDDFEADQLVSTLTAAGHEVAAQSVKDEHWEERLAQDADLVGVAGGDGTARKVFKELAGKPTPAALIPVGSANNIAQTLGLEEDDASRALNGTPRAFDIGTFDGHVFVESAGGGIFADVIVRASEVEDRVPDDKVTLGLRVLRDAVGAAPSLPWRIALDGEEMSREVLAAEVMNVRQIGPNLPIAPMADPGDGLLDLVLIEPRHRDELSRYVEARLAGTETAPPQFDVYRGKRVELEPPHEAPLHVDDELVQDPPGRATASIAANVAVLFRDP